MYIKDLLKLLEHHWLSDRSVFLHERQRVHLSALILILASTLSRPGAIIESDGAVSTDKALSYGNMRVFIIRKPSKPDRNVIILEITLFLPKCHQREQKQKPVTFLLHEHDDRLVFFPVLQFLTLAFDDRAFEDSSTTCPADLYRLQVPENENALYIRWKEPMLNIPICRCADRYGGVIRTSSDRALPYGDFQEFLCRLGWNAGLRQELTPYCFRRGAADILDSMLSRRLEFGSELPLLLCDREFHTCGAQPDDGSFSIKASTSHIIREDSIPISSPHTSVALSNVTTIALQRKRQ